MATAINAILQPAAQETLLAAAGVTKVFDNSGNRILVLDRVDLELRTGEFMALLGPSGSGKSTLLRILAGLVEPSLGQVLAKGEPLRGANPHVAVVFQSFALYPWLTVQENVELGLLAKELRRAERQRRALHAIDLIGLDGFEDAYPKELSGGMRQRVGFARALVVEPEVLLMDEPFSALDVLTAENLRHELVDLWQARRIPTRAILMVTHNIDEAVAMADRLIVFDADPGRVRVELPGLPLAVRAKGAEHSALVDTIWGIMTNPRVDVETLLQGARPVQPAAAERPYQTLPHVAVGHLTGFVERLDALGGREDLYALARDLHLDADDLLSLAEAAALLGFAEIQEGDVLLTDVGRRYAHADVQEEKELFRQQALARVELIKRIVDALEADDDHSVPEEPFLTYLAEFFSAQEARRQLDTAIDWGRYAERFAYDDDSGELYLD
jgi:NitT/TauT family transport system ATP-binding protein